MLSAKQKEIQRMQDKIQSSLAHNSTKVQFTENKIGIIFCNLFRNKAK